MNMFELLCDPKDELDVLASRAIFLMWRAQSRQAKSREAVIACWFADYVLHLISDQVKHYPFLADHTSTGPTTDTAMDFRDQSQSMSGEENPADVQNTATQILD